MDEMKDARAAYRHASRMAGSADPEEKKMGETMCARMKAAAAALGADIEKDPDGEPKPEGEKKPGTAAADLPAPKVEEKKPDTASATASRATAEKPASVADVLKVIDERDALNQLLTGNADRIPEGHRSLLANLTTARAYVAGLPPKAAPPGTAGDTGGPVPHAPNAGRPWRKPLNAQEAFMASRVRNALGKTEADEAAFDKRVDDDGGITISMVEIVEKRRAARRAGRSVSA